MADDSDIIDIKAELAGLRTGARRATARLDDHESKITQAFERLDEIDELLGTKSPEFALSPWWWPSLNREEATEAWTTLTQWVDEVVVERYDKRAGGTQSRGGPLGELPYGARLLRCWFAHPVIVDQLSALHWAQRGDYRRNALPHAPIEWQMTWLPRTLDAAAKEFSDRQCLRVCPHYNAGVADPANQIKHDELSLPERMAWIKNDVESREAAPPK